MKILIISDGFPPQAGGGAEQVAYLYASELARTGHSVTVFTTVQKKEQAGDTMEEGMRVVRVYANYHPRWRAYVSLYNPQTIPALKKLFKDEKFDVIHAHNVHQYVSYHALRLARKSCEKVFLTAHDVMTIAYGKLYPRTRDCANPDYPTGFFAQMRFAGLRFNPLRGPIIRYYLSFVTRILCVSGAVERILNESSIKNTMVFHNGVSSSDMPLPESTVQEFKKKFALIEKKIILFGGRVTEGKGGMYVVAYLQKIAPSVPDAVLVVMGKENETTRRLQEKAREADLEDRVICTGWLSGDTLRSAYRIADVVIVPSLNLDPFPTVNLEAMAAGKPVVATCFGGSRESIVDGETGYIANPYDVDAFSDRIAELFDNQEEANRFGNAGRKRVEAEFDIRLRARQLIELFKRS